MRIAFYAPLKAPGSSRPSGDRQIARNLMVALERAGHRVEPAGRFRSLDLTGDAARQRKIERIGEKLADRFLCRVAGGRQPRPDVWITYENGAASYQDEDSDFDGAIDARFDINTEEAIQLNGNRKPPSSDKFARISCGKFSDFWKNR